MGDNEELVEIGEGPGWTSLWERMDVCGYYAVYVGPCRRVPPSGHQYCTDHEGLACEVCGEQAVTEVGVYCVNGSHHKLCIDPECKDAAKAVGCQFDIAQRGRCGRPLEPGQKVCAEHSSEKCSVCGGQATNQCHIASSSFVCGYNLCDSAECKSKHGGLGSH